MSVKFHNFGGALGWNLQKRFPKLSSESYLKLQFLTRNKLQKKYIEYFLEGGEVPKPLVVNLETINRCNSTCSFCTHFRWETMVNVCVFMCMHLHVCV